MGESTGCLNQNVTFSFLKLEAFVICFEKNAFAEVMHREYEIEF